MNHVIMDRIKQCYADEVVIAMDLSTMIIAYDRSCAIINAFLA